jgi:hypothetical protein
MLLAIWLVWSGSWNCRLSLVVQMVSGNVMGVLLLGLSCIKFVRVTVWFYLNVVDEFKSEFKGKKFKESMSG